MARTAPDDVPVTTTRPQPSADVALEVRNLRVPGATTGVDLRVRRGEVLGLTGRRRSGLREIAGALTGEIPAQCDAVTLHGEDRPVPSSTGSAALRLDAYRPDDDAYGVDPGATIALDNDQPAIDLLPPVHPRGILLADKAAFAEADAV